jgi:MFS family permease
MLPPPVRWFLFANALAGVGVGAGRMLTSLYAVELQADEELMALIAGAQSLGLLLMALPAGALLARLGPRRLFVAGTIAPACAYAITPLWQHGLWLAASTVLLSLCLPARFVAMNAVFLAQLPHWGQDKAGWMRGTHMVGLLLAGPGLAVLLLNTLGASAAYLAIAAATLCTALLARQTLAHGAPVVASAAVRGISAPLRLLAGDRGLRGACVRELAGQMVNGFFAFFMVVIAIRQLQLSAAEAAMFVTLQGAAFVTALFCAGRIVQRFGAGPATRYSLLSVTAALALLGLARDAPMAWLGCTLLGLALGLLHVANVTRLSMAGQRHGAAAVTSLSALAGPAGGLLGGLLGGVLGGLVGLQAVFLLMLPVFVVLALRADRPALPRTAATPTSETRRS